MVTDMKAMCLFFALVSSLANADTNISSSAVLPGGGTTGQALTKASNASYDYIWATISGGGTVWGGITGTLSNQTDLQTALNAKQATGNYITGLTGDVLASGPGSVASTIQAGVVTNSKIANSTIDLTAKVTGLLPVVNQASQQTLDAYHVDFTNGNDSTGDGSAVRPWKTLQIACTAASLVADVNDQKIINLSGGETDSDTANPIVCPPNIILNSVFPINLAHALQITTGTAGPGNDLLTLNNISTTSLTWTKNDNTTNTVTLNNCGFTTGLTLKQSGVGSMIFTANFLNATGLDFKPGSSGIAILNAPYLLGTTTFEDSGAASYFQMQGGYAGSAITISGGSALYLSGVQFDTLFGASLTTVSTGNGTPFIQSDDGSIPPSITGPNSIELTSHAQHVAYAPALSTNWASAPADVASALDRLVVTQQSASGSQPTCDSTHRGLQWLIQGGAGVADIFQVCQKNAANAYVWVTH